jgi:hypothetical protein
MSTTTLGNLASRFKAWVSSWVCSRKTPNNSTPDIVYGSLNPLAPATHKTAYQQTVEACLPAAATAFANENYVEEFVEKDLVIRAMIMAEELYAGYGDRIRYMQTRTPDSPPYDPRKFFYPEDFGQPFKSTNNCHGSAENVIHEETSDANDNVIIDAQFRDV